VFTNPRDSKSKITFIDTPGMADTRGADQDNANIQKILEICTKAEQEGTLAGVILVMKGAENRETISVKTICTVLMGNLPKYVLDNLVVVFSNCAKEINCQAKVLVPFDISEEQYFYFENPVFNHDLPKLRASSGHSEARRMVELQDCFESTMDEVHNILRKIVGQGQLKKGRGGGFADLSRLRYSIQTEFHAIKGHLFDIMLMPSSSL
jgi:hypothetical protein